MEEDSSAAEASFLTKDGKSLLYIVKMSERKRVFGCESDDTYGARIPRGLLLAVEPAVLVLLVHFFFFPSFAWGLSSNVAFALSPRFRGMFV